MDEAETGLKSALAVKIYGPDLSVLEEKAEAVRRRYFPGAGHQPPHRRAGIGPAEPRQWMPDREKIARYGLNVADVDSSRRGGDGRQRGHAGDSGGAAIRSRGPNAGAVSRNMQEIQNLLITTPDGQHLPSEPVRRHPAVENGASFIYREGNSRYIGVQYSVEGRDLAQRGRRGSPKASPRPLRWRIGYRFECGGEYSELPHGAPSRSP